MDMIVAQPPADAASLPALIDRAVTALANARTSAEVLEARVAASVAYDAAKNVGRFARVRQASDELVRTAHETQARALEIESIAERRLADEYDAAVAAGEVARYGKNKPGVTTLAALGIPAREIQHARRVRDAELKQPGIVRRVLDDALSAGGEPTKASVNKAICAAVPSPHARPTPPQTAAMALVVACRRSVRKSVNRYLEMMPTESDRLVLFGELDAELRRLRQPKVVRAPSHERRGF